MNGPGIRSSSLPSSRLLRFVLLYRFISDIYWVQINFMRIMTIIIWKIHENLNGFFKYFVMEDCNGPDSKLGHCFERKMPTH